MVFHCQFLIYARLQLYLFPNALIVYQLPTNTHATTIRFSHTHTLSTNIPKHQNQTLDYKFVPTQQLVDFFIAFRATKKYDALN